MLGLKINLELNMFDSKSKIIIRNQPISRGFIVVLVFTGLSSAILLVFIGGCPKEFLKWSEGLKALYCARLGNRSGA